MARPKCRRPERLYVLLEISVTGDSVEEWRKNILKRLDPVLVAFDLVLCVIFLLVGYLTGNIYFRGVGIGLLIAGVTAGIAYLFKRKM